MDSEELIFPSAALYLATNWPSGFQVSAGNGQQNQVLPKNLRNLLFPKPDYNLFNLYRCQMAPREVPLIPYSLECPSKGTMRDTVELLFQVLKAHVDPLGKLPLTLKHPSQCRTGLIFHGRDANYNAPSEANV